MFKGKSFDVSKVKCYSRNKMGHFAKDYWSKRKTQKRGKHHASTTEDDESKKKQKGSPSEKERRKEF